jgi:predicted DNA binding CopG/RHH family protein
MKERLPRLGSDEETEAFVATSDLTEYDLSRFERVRFEFEKKTAQLNMRVPKSLLDAVKKRAKARGVPYTRLVREAMELVLARRE